MPRSSPLTPVRAVLVGHATITLPVLVIMSGVGFIVYVLTDRVSFGNDFALSMAWQVARLILGVFLAVVPAWMWWSRGVRRWREWTEGESIHSEQLEKLAVRTLLVWPNRRFERSQL